jgi:nicotinamide phosphoribosyltransferase
MDTHNVLFTIENTDENVPWLTNYLETSLMCGTWYPITVASISYDMKQTIKKYCDITGSQVSIFHLNDFSGRGGSSEETVAIGAAAHLINFAGTDSIEGNVLLSRFYGADICCGSVIAAEHSTITSWGKENELKAYENILNKAPDDAIVSIVIDSYDDENAVKNLLGGILKQKILSRKGKVVFRPDSGDVLTRPAQVLKWLWEIFGGTVNSKGFKVLNPHVYLIQGDGITRYTLPTILQNVTEAGFATENIVFGCGAGLIQKCDRDTMKFAMKCSAAKINNKWTDVFKDPKTDSGKKSKRGRLALINENGKYITINENDLNGRKNELVEVFRSGEITKQYTLSEIRERAKI